MASTTTSKRRPAKRTNEEREAEQSELLEQLGARIDALTTTTGWTDYLESASKFHDYSFGNLMLIAMQRPTATRCAGYKTWQAMGRQVLKGERGICILAPSVRTGERENAKTGEVEKFKFISGFRTVRVFDVGQTDGEPLPKSPAEMWAEARGGKTNGTVEDFDLAVAAAGRLGLTVEVHADAPENGSRGWFSPGTPVVHVVSDDYGHMTKTLLHELSHAVDFDGGLEGRDARRAEYAENELIAESSAYIVAVTLGIDAATISDESTVYLAAWAGRTRTVRRSRTGDQADAAPADALQDVAKRVLDVARHISDALFDTTSAAVEDDAEVAAA